MDKTSETRYLYKLDDYVTYRKNGVCRIADITVQNFGGQGRKEYYALSSVYDANTKVFVPVGSELEKEMNYAPKLEEIYETVEKAKKTENMWVDDCKARAMLFESIISSGDRAKMLWIVWAVSAYKAEMESAKKKMKATDLKYLAMAESLLAGDFAFSLGMQKCEVIGKLSEIANK